MRCERLPQAACVQALDQLPVRHVEASLAETRACRGEGPYRTVAPRTTQRRLNEIMVFYILLLSEWLYSIAATPEDKEDFAWLLRLGTPWRKWSDPRLADVSRRYARAGDGGVEWSSEVKELWRVFAREEFGDVGTDRACATRVWTTMKRWLGVLPGRPGEAHADLAVGLTTDSVLDVWTVPREGLPEAAASTRVNVSWLMPSTHIADEKVCSQL